MELTQVLDHRIVDLSMTAKNKDEALTHLSERLKEAGYITDIDQFKADIYLREAEGITGIGNYIAIPHGKSDAVENIGIAIGKVNDEIEWESLDGQGVKVIFLFAVSNNTDYARNHMKLLSEVARNLGNEAKVERLLEVKTFEELSDVFK